MSENLDLKIRAEMRKRRMTFKELAALVGISGAYLSDILNGNRDGKSSRTHRNCKNIRYSIGGTANAISRSENPSSRRLCNYLPSGL